MIGHHPDQELLDTCHSRPVPAGTLPARPALPGLLAFAEKLVRRSDGGR
jgi:hypothetical protein